MDNRAFASATELSAEIRDRRIGCVELLDYYLARVERDNPTLNAIVVWEVDQARDALAPQMPPSRAASAGDRGTAFR